MGIAPTPKGSTMHLALPTQIADDDLPETQGQYEQLAGQVRKLRRAVADATQAVLADDSDSGDVDYLRTVTARLGRETARLEAANRVFQS